MIIATAGHVDHGKTSLVRALTGVDTDRLEDEKRRGLTIDLGFAYVDLGGDEFTGFVDVPGHDRFVRNMLAGVSRIDLALLVVAADDGPMPQTREHLAILDLLGAHRAMVVLTKIDRVSPQRRAQAGAEIRELLAPTRFRDAPMHAVSTVSLEGLDDLRAQLSAARLAHQDGAADGHFRLAVDRCFAVAGAGLVVTGVVLSGQAHTGDALIVSPQGVAARIRGIHAQQQAADTARAGQRCALNLTGADLRRSDIERGQWLVAPPAHAPTERLDAQVTVLADATRALAHFTPVQVHIGAAAIGARIALLTQRSVEPGSTCLAQLVLERPISALRGDRFVIRDPAAQRTLGGGVVIDPFAPARGRARAPRLQALAAMSETTPELALAALLHGAPAGMSLDRFDLAWNLSAAAAASLHDRLAVHRLVAPPAVIGLSATAWQHWQDAVRQAAADWHAAHPEQVGPIEQLLIQAARAIVVQGLVGVGAEMPAAAQVRAVAAAAIRTQAAEGRLVREGICLRLPDHRAVLAPVDQALLDRVVAMLREAGLRPPIAGELAAALGMERADLLTFLRRMAALGHLLPVAANRYFLPDTLHDLADVAQRLAAAAADGSFDAAEYRDASGIGRNLSIEVLEFLDRAGVTRFLPNRRRCMA